MVVEVTLTIIVLSFTCFFYVVATRSFQASQNLAIEGLLMGIREKAQPMYDPRASL
jgi:hypothetical protein